MNLIEQLREYASNNGYSHGDYADTMCQAADRIAELESRPAAPVNIGVGDPEAVFADFCDREGYPSDSEIDGALRAAFYEGIKYCCVEPTVAPVVAEGLDPNTLWTLAREWVLAPGNKRDVPKKAMLDYISHALAAHPVAGSSAEQDAINPTYAWMSRAAHCGIAEVEQSAQTLMAYYCGAEFPEPMPASEAAKERGRMSDELRTWIEGMSVSLDVSTGEADADHRYYGVVNEVMDCESDKHGVTLLVYDAQPNFDLAAPTAPTDLPESFTYTVDGEVMSPLGYISHLHSEIDRMQSAAQSVRDAAQPNEHDGYSCEEIAQKFADVVEENSRLKAQPTIAVEEVRDAARYRFLRDNGGYDLAGPRLIGNWNLTRKEREGEGRFFFGEHLDRQLDKDIAAIASTTTTSKD